MNSYTLLCHRMLTNIAKKFPSDSTVAIPVGCDLLNTIPIAFTTNMHWITYGKIDVGDKCGIECNVNDEQYFWYRFWRKRIVSIQVKLDTYRVQLSNADDTWVVTQGCIQHNAAYITPYAKFRLKTTYDAVILHFASQNRPLCVDLRLFVALSMAMNDSVLY